ncbi:MAG: glycosyltransferase family 39 protein, partial [Chloroflexota bacterium]
MKFNRTKPLLLFIFWVAFTLRVALLTEVPPGLTHDEANHGREALGLLDGIFLFYFPLNYGSEPFYSYMVAGFMGLLGESLFALRFVNVVFGTAVLAITYSWVKRAFSTQTALLTIGIMSVSFWPLATSRQALRAGMLPFFFGLAVWYYWILFLKEKLSRQQQLIFTALFGLCIGLTLHIYLASRVAWLVFPLFVIYLFIIRDRRAQRMWQPTGAGLLFAGLLFLPMYLYLQRNPFALTRLEMLDGPLLALTTGNFQPVLANISSALLAFIWPGRGDLFLAYNIPGRPVLDGVTAVFFVVGLLITIWHWKRPSYAFVLLWFGVGIIPSLLTGATANTTRNLAALAVVHLIPAIGFSHIWQFIKQRQQWHIQTEQLVSVLSAIWLIFAGWQTTRAYFVQWAQLPEVRGAYQQNLVQALAFVEDAPPEETILLSTVYPGPAHDPSISLVLTAQSPHSERWMNAQYALLLPNAATSQAVVPQSTAAHPYFLNWLTPIETVQLRATDLDPNFTAYAVDGSALSDEIGSETAVNFNNAITLIHTEWLTHNLTSGNEAELVTIWRVNDPSQIGPIVPPTFTTDVVMFAQILGEDGVPLAQRDALDAPSWGWQEGDTLIQIHPIVLPETAVAGEYRTIVG